MSWEDEPSDKDLAGYIWACLILYLSAVPEDIPSTCTNHWPTLEVIHGFASNYRWQPQKQQLQIKLLSTKFEKKTGKVLNVHGDWIGVVHLIGQPRTFFPDVFSVSLTYNSFQSHNTSGKYFKSCQSPCVTESCPTFFGGRSPPSW